MPLVSKQVTCRHYRHLLVTSAKAGTRRGGKTSENAVVQERKKQISYITVLYGEEKMKRGLRLLISKIMIKEFWLQ